MRLTGAEYGALADALRDAYGDYDTLRSMLRRADRSLQDITPDGKLLTVITDLIEYAEAHDWVHELVAAARADNPDNIKLLKLAAAMGLAPGGVAVDEAGRDAAFPAVSANLERLVDPARGIADLGKFAARIQELLRQVCAVEVDDDGGTGFLIGPDTILTNYHVVEDVIDGKVGPAAIRVRFDFRRLRDGKTTNAGKAYELADAWLVHAEPYSEADLHPYDAASLPAEHELDYAVLRTREPIGTLKSTGVGAEVRGWVTPRATPFEFATDAFLMVVQHPCLDPISYDYRDDAVLRVNPNGTRVHYRNNTMPGSSGAPVLDRDQELVALHHGGEPGSPDRFLPCKQRVAPAAYNEGIPIARVQAHLASLNLASVFGG